MKARRLFCLTLAFVLLAAGCKKEPTETSTHEKPAESTILLCQAAEEGNIEQIRSLIADGADVNAAKEYSHTPLYYAVRHGHETAVELLIAKGANIEAEARGGQTPLHWAADSGHKDVAELLIAKGADINARYKYLGTPLCQAAWRGHKDVAEVLIVNGADVNAKGLGGRTPLHYAVSHGNKNIVELLVDRGADVNAKREYGYTPMSDAVMNGREDILELLLAKGADVEVTDDHGHTLLHQAAELGRISVIGLLITKGYDVNKRCRSGYTPLHYAARECHLNVAELLIAKGADVNAKIATGWTSLHYAAHRGHYNIAELLLENGADVDAKTTSGWTPLHHAAHEGHLDVAQLLIAERADVNAKTTSGWTPLHRAAYAAHKDVIELLVANGADIDALGGRRCETPLHGSLREGHKDIVELLLSKGADIDAENKQGHTALECAVATGRADFVELLSSNSLNVNAENRHDETPLDFAVGYGRQDSEEPRTDEERLVFGNSTFAFDLYQQLRSREGNLFLSPYSISTALAMTYAGARGNTEKQMAETLGFSLEQKNLHPAFAHLQAGLNKLQEDGSIKLCVANSLWPQLGQPFLDEYLSLVEKYYDVSITPVDYVHAREAARKTINEWVENKTDNRIKDLIKAHHLNEFTRLVLTNAIYFKGNWESQFEPTATEEATFYVSPKKSVQVPMMRQTENVRYAEFRSLQILEIPYVGNSLSMLVLLPRRIEGLKQLEDSLSVENLSFWRQRLEEREVIIFLPKFKMTSSFDLKETLQAIGMVDAFTFPGANFAGFDGDPRWFFIGEVVHKAYVDVNEEGTEAAAATAVVMGLGGVGAQPPTFRADHPFLFLIQDRQTGSILFIGRVTDPTKCGQ